MKRNNILMNHFYLCIVYIFLTLPIFGQTTITIQPGPAEGKDARVWSLDPSSNFSDHKMTKINAWTWSSVFGIERSFIEFDLSILPENSEITEAKLSLYYHSLPGNPEQTHYGSNNLMIRRIITSWSETGITWLNQPSSTEINHVEIPPSSSPTQDYLDMDVTGMVQDAFQDIDKKCGFSFQMKYEETYRRIGLSSSDHPNPDNWPKLEIIYTCHIDLGNDTSICSGDSIYLAVGDEYVEYIWNNGYNSLGQWVNEGGQYWVQVTGASGCIASDTIEISIIPNPAIQLNLGPDIIACFEDVITLDAGSGYENYLWNSGDTTQVIQVVESGTYIVNVNTTCGSGSDTINILFLPEIEIELGNDTIFCAGDSVYLSVDDNYSGYIWSNGCNSFSQWIDEGGLYWVQVTDTAGCIASDTILITIMPDPGLQLNLGPDIFACFDEIITLNAGPGYDNYIWSTGDTTQTIQVSSDGTFIVYVNAVCGNGSDTINVLFNPEIDISLGNDTLLCQGENLTLEPGFGFLDYLWQDGSTLPYLDVFEEGLYTVIVTDINGCSAEDDILVSYHEMSLDLPSDTGFCENLSLDLSLNQTYSAVLWMDTVYSTSFVINIEGTYWVTVIDSINEKVCVLNDTVNVETYVAPKNLQIPENVNCCLGDTVIINAGIGSAFKYIWNNGNQDSIIYLSEPGNYEIMVYNSCDTIFSQTQLVPWPTPDFQIQMQQSNETGETILFIDNEQELALWSNGFYSHFIEIDSPGNYWAEVENEYGCKSVDTMEIEPFNCNFKIPRIFTPNGDSYNSHFYLESTQIRELQIDIFNRWGEKVFNSTDPYFKWDGNRNGHPCPEGTYYWIILYNCKGFVSSDLMIQEKGTITILR